MSDLPERAVWPVGTPVDHVMTPDASLRPPGWTPPGANRAAPVAQRVAHPRPFALQLVPGSAGVSRAVAHVNNVEYVRWLDRAAELHADSLGFTRASMLAIDRMWFVARHEVNYRAEAFPGEALHVFTWVRTLGRSTSWRDTVIVRARDGAPVCEASTCWAYVDLSTRKPARIPPDVAAAFDALEGAACTSRS
ncbi:MAG: acyl-CoA thioesterase [Phycisphaerae bacterium]|nr:acyl-CoA thioesterase [Phycisphaerae bacterium]